MANDVEVRIVYTDKESADKLVSGAEKTGKKAGSKLGSALAVGFGAALGVGTLKVLGSAISSIKSSFSSSIDAAQVQEDAINQLNSALLVTGKLTSQTSKEIQQFASDLQQQTKFGDEAILNTAALVQSLADLDTKGLKRATAATADLSAALSIDLNSAANIVGKALSGNVGALSRYGVSVKKGATEAETLSNVLTALEGKFGGTAQQQINTFSGALQQTKNTFGDLLEQIGFIITKNPIAISLVKSLGDSFKKAIESVKQFSITKEAVIGFTASLFDAGNILIKFVIKPLEVLGNLGNLVFQSIKLAIQFVIADLGKLAGGIGFILEKTGLLKGAAKSLQDFGVSSQAVLTEQATATKEAFTGLFDTSFSEGLQNRNEEFKNFLTTVVADSQQANEEIKNQNNNLANNINSTTEQAASSTIKLLDILSITFQKVEQDTKKLAEGTAKIVKNNLVRGISGGIQNIVNSIAKGENAFANFGRFLLQTIGDMSIQLGTFLLTSAQGIASLQAVGIPATATAGIALIALGSVLKSLGGGGGSTSSTTSTGGSNFSAGAGGEATLAEDIAEPDAIQEQGPRVALTVEGNIFNNDETKASILDFLNEQLTESGGTINNASFA